MSDIFISYAREDRPRAEAIAKALEAHGWSVWWDWVIPTGKKFRRVIEDEIGKARCVMVLWSAGSIESDWVIEEASEGNDRGILIPVLIEKVRPPMGFRSMHAADLTSWEAEASAPAFQRLRADIEVLTGVPAKALGALPEPSTNPPSHQSGAQTNPKDGLAYVWIPPGEFQMGAALGDTEAAAHEKPRHPVRITKGFWLSATPVTVEAYKQFTGKLSQFKMPPAPDFNPDWSKLDHPIVRVTWDEAKAYCEWAGGRLPTEAEWEYAARGGKDGLKYPWGDGITPENANYAGSKWKGTSPVRSYPPNAWGLYDMAGNVWQWVADWYGEDYYASSPAEDPRGPQSGKVRVLRGGSFSGGTRDLRASNRVSVGPVIRVGSIGFRCLREVVP